MASKSKKFNQMVNGFDMLHANLPADKERYAHAHHDITEEGVDVYHFNAGYEGMPADYNVTFETPEALETEMRKFVDFRSWNFKGW